MAAHRRRFSTLFRSRVNPRAPGKQLVGLVALLCLLAAFAGWMGGGRALGQATEPVFGVLGRLEPVTGQSYANAMVLANSQRVAVAGATPEVDGQLTQLAARLATVKVWGTMQQNAAAGLPLIVVTAVVESNAPVVSTPTPAGRMTPVPATELPNAIVSVYAAYVRAGPGRDFTPVGTVTEGTVCRIIGRATFAGWFNLQCPLVTGWVAEGLFLVQGSLATVPLITQATPTPVPSPTPSGAWRVNGYPNRDLSGPPAVVFDVPSADNAWGQGSPNPALPVDNFSLRLDRTLRFSPGSYQLVLAFDDGARLYLNGQLVLSDWADGGLRTRTWQGSLAGDVQLRIEYYEAYGDASVRLGVTSLSNPLPAPAFPTPSIPATPPANGWLTTYYNNLGLQEPVVFTRIEPRSDVYPLNYEFSLASPVPGVVGEDTWSARWRGRFYFSAGDYRFYARGNDGVRVYIDGIRLIDAWPNNADTVSNIFRSVGAGEHEMAVEMYDAGGLAWVRMWWEQLNSPTIGPGPSRDP